MIILGVFSMGILERLKALFTGEKIEEKGAEKAEVKETPVKTPVDSGTKTSESKTKKADAPKAEAKEFPVKVEEAEPKKQEAPKEEAKAPEVKEEPVEEEEAPKGIIDDEVENEDSNNNNKKEDNMTLLTDTELINDSNGDKEFTAEFIDAGLETVKHCFQCGTCSGGCPSGRRTPYKVRQIVRKCLLGLKEEVITDDALWMCTTCYTCQERCPRSVTIVNRYTMSSVHYKYTSHFVWFCHVSSVSSNVSCFFNDTYDSNTSRTSFLASVTSSTHP